MRNQFKYTILPEGTIRLETGEYDDVSHNKADMFAKALAERLGGDIAAEKKPRDLESEELEFDHHHDHDHDHSHETE